MTEWPIFANHMGDRIVRLKQRLVQQRYVLLSPGYHRSTQYGLVYPNKHYPHWPALATQIEREGLEVVVNLAGQDHRVYGNISGVPFSGDIAELVTMMAFARAIICTDSGVAHLASVITPPVIVLMSEDERDFPQGAARSPLAYAKAPVHPLVRSSIAAIRVDEVMGVLSEVLS